MVAYDGIQGRGERRETEQGGNSLCSFTQKPISLWKSCSRPRLCGKLARGQRLWAFMIFARWWASFKCVQSEKCLCAAACVYSHKLYGFVESLRCELSPLISTSWEMIYATRSSNNKLKIEPSWPAYKDFHLLMRHKLNACLQWKN